MEYIGIGLLFGLLSLPFIIYFIYHLDMVGQRHDKVISNGQKDKKIASASAILELPECNCKKCGFSWMSRRVDILPASCTRCGARDWWFTKTEYNHYRFLSKR